MKFILLLLFTQVAFSSTLVQNYQEEVAFLLAQKNSLETQIINNNNDSEKNIQIAEKKIETLQNKLVNLSLSNNKLATQLADSEKSLESIDQNLNLFNTTMLQAQSSLELPQSDVETKLTNSERAKIVLNEVLKKLYLATSISKTKGYFFSLEGVEEPGDIVSYGNIAKYSKIPGASFPLIPVGNGKFKAISKLDDIALDSNIKIDSLPIYIFEQANKAIDEEKEQTFMEMIEAGGAIAYVIFGFGIAAIILIILRGYFLFTANKNDKELHLALKNGEIKNLSEFLAKQDTPLARVLNKTYKSLGKNLEERENIIEESILGELNYLDRFGAMILILASVSPLMGLLGTVTGMIATFDIITQFGTGDPKLLSGGISEALITTKLGLVVAIPSLMIGNLFNGWSNKIKLVMEKEALNLSNNSEEYQGIDNV